jgi:hypothetical protein
VNNYDELRQWAQTIAPRGDNLLWHRRASDVLALLDENAALRAVLRNVLLADAVIIDDEQVEWPLWEARKALGDAS